MTVEHRPRLLSDNGSAYISADLADYLARHGIPHTHGAPYHPQTQGKIERYHRSIKNLICLENFYFPGQLEQAIATFVDYYNHHRYHESLHNLVPAAVFSGRSAQILNTRQLIKQRTLAERRAQHLLFQSST